MAISRNGVRGYDIECILLKNNKEFIFYCKEIGETSITYEMVGNSQVKNVIGTFETLDDINLQLNDKIEMSDYKMQIIELKTRGIKGFKMQDKCIFTAKGRIYE